MIRKLKLQRQLIQLSLLVGIVFSTSSYGAVPQIERNALIELYNSTNGQTWDDNSNWLVGDPCENQ